MPLTEFRFYLIRQGRKPSTIYRHSANLKRLLRDVSPFTKQNLDGFFLKLKNEGKRGKFLNSLVNTVRVWGQFQEDNELVKYPEFPEEPTLKSTMSDKEIESFLALIPQKNQPRKLYHCWTMFFSIAAYTGMRPGEVSHLTVNQVDFGRQVFVLIETKTNIPRLVPIPENLTDRLKLYIDGLDGKYLFPSRNGGNNHGSGQVFDNVDWHYNFHTRIKRLGIKRPGLTPYSLRHSLITRLLEEDVNLFKVQKIVGHRQIQTTAQYTHLTTKDIQEALKKHPLIRKSTDPGFILRSLVSTIRSFGLDEDKRFAYVLVEKEDGIKLEVKIKPPA